MKFSSASEFSGFAGQFLGLVCAERLTVYATSASGSALGVWFDSAGDGSRKGVPVSCDTVAGYVAHTRRLVRIDDLKDTETMSAVYPELNLARVQGSDGGSTESLIAAPIVAEDRVLGVVEVANCTRLGVGEGFSEQDAAAVRQLAMHLESSLLAAEDIPSVEDVPDEPGVVQPPQAGAVPVVDEYEAPSHSGTATSPFESLVERGIVSRPVLENFGRLAAGGRMSVGHLLVEQAGVPLEEVGTCLQDYFGVPFVAYDPAITLDSKLLDDLNREFLAGRRWVPLSRNSTRAVILVDDPFDEARIMEAARVLDVPSCDVRVALAEHIARFIDPRKGAERPAARVTREVRVEDLMGDLQAESGFSEFAAGDATELLDENAPKIVQVVSRLIVDAIRDKASDIHIEPGWGERPGLARVRIDGLCHDVLEIPRAHMRAVLSRIKVMSDLDITERRVPQDGKMSVRMGEKTYELRVATVPTVSGESAVLRILSAGGVLAIEELGLSAANNESLAPMIERPHGIFLVVGPTGSGKTTTLHALLGHINTPHRKIWTAEDPVEITQPRLQQVQMNAKVNITFATALRAFLRADPDVILIGEMRDQETAHAGIEASLTGHLVFSTLHTNSAPETLTRLVDMGIDPITFADALIGVLAQRLIRKLCAECKKSYTPDQQELDLVKSAYGAEFLDELGVELDALELFRAVGCKQCRGTGYRGRIGIHELLVGSQQLKEMIVHKQPAAEIRRAAMGEGMRTLRQDGIAKALRGDTDLQQVWAATVD